MMHTIKRFGGKRMKKQSRGITLISLVITIIVLIILAGITIKGVMKLIGVSQKAAKDYIKAQEDESEMLENILDLMPSTQIEPDKRYPSVAKMKEDLSLVEGKIVKTQGYWSSEYGGSAYYDIVQTADLPVDEAKCIQLDNGLYAKLHAINDTITVNQFGAYGDGEHEDSTNIKKAINSGYSKIIFEGKSYLCDKPITISTSNVTILGNSSTLVMKEGYHYSTDPYRFIYIGNNNDKLRNIVLRDLQISTGTIVFPNNDAIQVFIENTDNITITNCQFEVREIDHDKSRHLTNIWVGGNTSKLNVTDNKIINLSNSSVGGNIWFSYGTIQDVNIHHNYIEKSSHDESIAIWQGNIENISIDRNEFYIHEEKVENPSNIVFTFGGINSNDIHTIKKIQFTNNTVNTSSQTGIFKTATADTVIFEGNTVKHQFIAKESASFWYVFENATNIKVKNNNIEISSNSSDIQQFTLSKEQASFENNTITTTSKFRYLFTRVKGIEFKHNNLNINEEMSYLFLNTEGIIQDNMISINSQFVTIIQFSQTDIQNNIHILNNTFNIKFPESSNADAYKFIELFQSKINGNEFKVEDNKFITNVTQNSRFLLINQSTDEDQTIYINNNSYGNFKRLIFSNSSGYTVIVNEKPYVANSTWQDTILE